MHGDRPYAGLLYVGLAWKRRLASPDDGLERLDTRELTLGVIGPASLAEQSQDLVHRLRGLERFRGWQHQLRNEPAFQLARERKFKPRAEGAVRPGWSSEAIGSWVLRAGNIETAASAGVELRAGWNLPNDFGSYPIRPGAENRPPSAAAALRTAQPRVRTAGRPPRLRLGGAERRVVNPCAQALASSSLTRRPRDMQAWPADCRSAARRRAGQAQQARPEALRAGAAAPSAGAICADSGLTARMKPLANLSSTRCAMRSSSSPWSARKARASSAR